MITVKRVKVSIDQYELKELKAHAQSFHKLNRLMSKVLKYRRSTEELADLEVQYEMTLYECGRLKGIEEGLELTRKIS